MVAIGKRVDFRCLRTSGYVDSMEEEKKVVRAGYWYFQLNVCGNHLSIPGGMHLVEW